MKKFLIFAICFLSFSSFASDNLPNKCEQALPTNHLKFCPSFKSVAYCHCIATGMPGPRCENMEWLYGQMIALYKTLEGACRMQKDTDVQTCIDDWNCYRLGGKDSKGRLCSATGKKCG